MTVDTQYLAKGSAAGDIIPFMNWIADELGKHVGGVGGGYQIAWRMTASALKNSVKDMYKGELMVIGDPAVKPYDKFYLEDLYERMQGTAEVEATVNTLSVENGYTTSIYPDCIATIDDKYEQFSHHLVNQMVSKYIAVYGTTVVASSLFAGRTRPLIGAIAEGASKFNMGASKFVDSIGSIIGKGEISKSEGFIKTMATIDKALGIDPNSMAFRNYVNKISKWRDSLPSYGKASTFDDVASRLKKIAEAFESLDPETAIKELEKMDSSLYKGDTEAIEGAKTELKNAGEKYVKNIEDVLSDVDSKDVNDAKEILKSLEKSVVDESGTKQKAIKEAINTLDNLGEGPSNIKELKSWANINKVIGDNIDVVKADKKLLESANAFLKTTLSKTEGIFTKAASKTAGKGLTSLAGLLTGKGSALSKVSSLVPIVEGGLLASTAMMALEAGIITVITGFAYEYVERWMKNLQVLQVFPLKKDGRVYTAGLDGSRGAVIGSPTEKDPGLIEGMISQIMQDKEGGVGASFYNLIKNLVVSQNMQDIADNYLHGSGITNTEGATGRQKLLNDLLKSATADEMKSKNSYNAMLLQPRITKFNSVAGKEAFDKYTISNGKDVEKNNTILSEMVPASKIAYISNLMSNKTFILEHDNISSDESTGKRYSELTTFNIESEDVKVNVIKETDGVTDMPFLRPEAWNVVVQLISKLDSIVNKESSLYSTKDYFKTHPIVFRSGLRAGDKSWASTGYYFKLQVTNSPEFKTAIEDTAKDVQDVMNSFKKEGQLFTWKAINEAEGTYQFVINPPSA